MTPGSSYINSEETGCRNKRASEINSGVALEKSERKQSALIKPDKNSQDVFLTFTGAEYKCT